MAYITDYTYASDDTDVSSHTGILPSYDVGDLLVWIVAKDSGTGTHLTTPNGWTTIYSGQLKNEMLACYKFAQANESSPTTSSSDSDAYQSSMFCIKGADQNSPVSTVDTQVDGSTTSYVVYNYFKPANTAIGNIHFSFLNPSGVGGASIENFGKRYINEETISMAMVIHANTIHNINNLPTILGVSQHTSAGMLQFEIVDDGNNISEPICINDLDIIELATDGMVNGGVTGNSSLSTFNGLPMSLTQAIVDNAGDIGFYPFQKAPYFKGSKGLKYTAIELTLGTPVDLSSDLFSVSVYPYKPKYQPAIGRGDQGRFVYLMDGSGNYIAFNIDAADNKLLNFAMQFTYIIDPLSTPFTSLGSVDLTNITKIGFGERSRTIVCYLAFNRLYRYRKSTILGGNSTIKSSFSTLLDYQDGSYFRPNLLQGQDILIQVPIEIGDGTTDIQFFDSDKILEYPANYNISTRDYLFHQRPNRSGINFNLTPSSVVDMINMSIQGKSKWYFTSTNNNGSINIKDSSIKGSGNIVLTSNMNFSGCIFDRNTMISGSINIVDGIFINPVDNYFIDLTDVVNFKNCSFKSFSGKTALYIPSTINNITLDNITSDGSGVDVYWAGSTGTLDINMINGSNMNTSSSAGGTVNFINTATLTFTGLENNTEVRIYTSDLSTELFGVENSTGDVNWQFSGDYNNIVVTIFNIGYIPQRLTLNLAAGVSRSIPIKLIKDRNYNNPV